MPNRQHKNLHHSGPYRDRTDDIHGGIRAVGRHPPVQESIMMSDYKVGELVTKTGNFAGTFHVIEATDQQITIEHTTFPGLRIVTGHGSSLLSHRSSRSSQTIAHSHQ